MASDPKKVASMIVSSLGDDPESPEGMDAASAAVPMEEDSEEGLNYAADDVLASLTANDPQMLKTALLNFIELARS